MTGQEPERQPDEHVTDDELAAENAAELPDREAMSVISPISAMGLRPGPGMWPGPVPADTTTLPPMDSTQPMEP
jgi:hypothetical protein